MVVTCDIEFDNNPEGSYFAGQVVTGKITLTADKSKQVQSILLKICGVAYTSWTEDHGFTYFTRSKTTKWYTGEDTYIASISFLNGNDDTTQMMVIEPGIQSYSFSCHIPVNCPSSFEGNYGHIRYTVVVMLKRPWKFDQTYTKGFTVWNVVDLNNDVQRLKEPSNTMLEKAFFFWPCKSLPLTIYVNMPQLGYVPGQKIPLSLLVNNDSNLTVEEIKVELVMLVCYYSQKPKVKTRSKRTVMIEYKMDSVMRHSKKLLTYQMEVPATPPTCHSLCQLIQINYQLEVEAKMPLIHPNQLVTVPITIGNIPLMYGSEERQFQIEPVTPITDRAAPLTPDSIDISTPTMPWEADSNIPYPEFREAAHVTVGPSSTPSTPYEYGQTAFTPKYPVYNVPIPTPLPEDDNVGNKGIWI